MNTQELLGSMLMVQTSVLIRDFAEHECHPNIADMAMLMDEINGVHSILKKMEQKLREQYESADYMARLRHSHR